MPTIDLLGTTLNISAQGTTETVGFADNIAMVGGYDAANADGSVTAGEAEAISGGVEAEQLFGENSELARAAHAASANPVDTIYAVPVPETTGNTESFAGTSSGTLSESPIFDPNVHPDHEVTATDVVAGATVTVNIVYEDAPSAPAEADTINLNPINGEWNADESSDYDITYDYGDYATALAEAVTYPVRFVAALTEDGGVASAALSQAQEEAKNGEFMRVVYGGSPNTPSTAAGSYVTATTSYRTVEVLPSRWEGIDGEVRGAAAVAGLLAGQPINAEGAITYDDLNGLEGPVHNSYRPTEAEQFSDDGVTAVDRTRTVVGGRTTSDETAFSRIHEVEIVDLVGETLLTIGNTYKGGGNYGESMELLERALRRTCRTFANQRPPLLASPDDGEPFTVAVDTGVSEREVVASVGIEPAPIMEEVTLNLNTGEVTTFEGVSV